jgi:hypothetical protein
MSQSLPYRSVQEQRQDAELDRMRREVFKWLDDWWIQGFKNEREDPGGSAANVSPDEGIRTWYSLQFRDVERPAVLMQNELGSRGIHSCVDF